MDKQMTISAFSDELAQVRTKKKEFLIPNSMPFRQLKSFLKILIGVQYENPPIGTARPDSRNNLYPRGHDVKALNFVHHIMILQETQRRIYPLKHFCTHPQPNVHHTIQPGRGLTPAGL